MTAPLFVSKLALALAMAVLAVSSAWAQDADPDLGAFGPQGPRMREQLWMLPSGTPGLAMRATVFRPADSAPDPLPRPLVVINHGTSEATRRAVSLPIYFWLSKWFVDRGYVVVLPQRRGHGATGGELVEGRDSCARPDHFESGQRGADDIAAAVTYMARQPFIARGQTIVVGVSTGGWASLALSSRNPPEVQAVVNFAGGRGGHAWGKALQICDQEQLIATAGRFGARSKISTLWLYSANDSFFGPALVRSMARAYANAGGKAELHVLSAYGIDGHTLADDQAGWELWGRQLGAFLDRTNSATEVAGTAAQVPISLR